MVRTVSHAVRQRCLSPCVGVGVRYLEPQRMALHETPSTFAKRVKEMICARAQLQDGVTIVQAMCWNAL